MESSSAIQNAFDDAFKIQKGLQMVDGINDLGGVVIDLEGGNYKISTTITIPAGGNAVLSGGTLSASETFPGDRHLIELWSPNSHKVKPKSSINSENLSSINDQNEAIYYEDITFRDILFDSTYRGGGIFITDSARIRINNCFFLHFTTQGILVENGHETFISSCFLGQHSTVGGDPSEKQFSGTAIDLASNDNSVTEVAIFSAAIGILLRGQANIINGVHCYKQAISFGGVGILVKSWGSQTRICKCYMDFNAIIVEDPSQVQITNGFFLGDGNVVLKSIEGHVPGLTIVDNIFTGNPKYMKPTVEVDGLFSDIGQVVVDRNNAIGMSLKSTMAKLTVPGNGTKWVADFSAMLLFTDRINHFHVDH